MRKSLGSGIWIGSPILTPSNPFHYINATAHTSPPRLSLMFEQHLSDQILFHHDDLYLCQPHTVIQLIEVASPPPLHSTSSYTSSSSSFEEEEDEEESIHSSYCSSDDEIDVRLSPRAPDTLPGRMKRILLWREQSPLLISGLLYSILIMSLI